MIAPITAISAPGIRRVIRRAAIITATTLSDTATVRPWAWGSAATVSPSLTSVCELDAVTPSMSGSCPIATWIPTPVRKPSSTVRDRKLARKPSRASRASISRAPVSKAASPASRTYSAEPGSASRTRAPARMAAVAESAATTRCRDDPNTANRAIGSSSVYSPVTTGIPAIRA